MEQITSKIAVNILLDEIAQIRPKFLICERSNFQVFIAAPADIPNILQEIGRVREVTFRQNGEGTGAAADIDNYDKHYLQLFVWDLEALRIVAGYRMGLGDEILNAQGISGFYCNSLFKIKKGLYDYLSKSIELGRSFVIEENQKQMLPFFLLWQGIYSFLKLNKQYKFLIGPVSISNFYTNTSKGLIVSFIKEHFYNEELASFVSPRTKFCAEKLNTKSSKLLKDAYISNFKDLESFLEKIEPIHFKVPILLKQYTRLNARFIGFNVDPKFSEVLDGFMILDLRNIPKAMSEMFNTKVNK